MRGVCVRVAPPYLGHGGEVVEELVAARALANLHHLANRATCPARDRRKREVLDLETQRKRTQGTPAKQGDGDGEEHEREERAHIPIGGMREAMTASDGSAHLETMSIKVRWALIACLKTAACSATLPPILPDSVR